MVVVVGGSGGIGGVIAQRFCAQGDRVINLDIASDEATARLCADGSYAYAPGDVSSAAGAAEAFRAVDAALGDAAPDVLVCAASVGMEHAFLDVVQAGVDRLLDVNVGGLVFACQEAARRMRDAGRGGRIVVITSVAAEVGWAREPIYCATKGAQASLVKAMAVKLGPHGIAVNAIAPAVVEVQSSGMAASRQRPGVLERIADRTLADRLGRPEDVAAAAIFLATAEWITGTTLHVDGGYLATGMAYGRSG